MRIRLAPIVILIALLSACGSVPVPQGAFYVGGERPALVVVPPDHDPFTPTPLLLILHGYRSDAGDVERFFPLAVATEVLGVVVVRPEGTTDRLGNRFWNAAPACCDFFGSGVDDAGYLFALIEEIRARIAVSDVILFGHSNGGFMAYALACAQPERFAAVVTIAGALPDPPPASCGTSGPARLLHLHGTSDWVIGYAGGSISDLPIPGIPDALPRYTGAEATVAAFAAGAGCGAPFEPSTPFDLDAAVPGLESRALEAACPATRRVVLWRMEGSGHEPRPAPGFAARLLRTALAR